jgi:hypothetical protein
MKFLLPLPVVSPRSRNVRGGDYFLFKFVIHCVKAPMCRPSTRDVCSLSMADVETPSFYVYAGQ